MSKNRELISRGQRPVRGSGVSRGPNLGRKGYVEPADNIFDAYNNKTGYHLAGYGVIDNLYEWYNRNNFKSAGLSLRDLHDGAKYDADFGETIEAVMDASLYAARGALVSRKYQAGGDVSNQTENAFQVSSSIPYDDKSEYNPKNFIPRLRELRNQMQGSDDANLRAEYSKILEAHGGLRGVKQAYADYFNSMATEGQEREPIVIDPVKKTKRLEGMTPSFSIRHKERLAAKNNA